MKFQQISLIGAGNLAWHLATQLEGVGHKINEIYSRHMASAERMQKYLYNCQPTDNLDMSESESALFIVAVPDDALKAVASQLVVPEGALVVHTSGAQPLDVLDGFDYNTGVFYPLQTFTYGRPVDLDQVPICIEAHDAEDLALLKKVAGTLSRKVEIMNSEQRLTLHLGAVFACNFTNHLLHLASNILDAEELEFDLIHPLIAETINKALETDPASAQTGPALRGDHRTMDRHLNLLADNQELYRIYQQLSRSIAANK